MDFYCHAAGLVIELDDSGHLDQQEYDQSRDRHLTFLGLKVLRFFNSDLKRAMENVQKVIFKNSKVETSDAKRLRIKFDSLITKNWNLDAHH